MKRKALERITAKYLRSLEHYSSRIPGSFDVEAIHDLRVDYKKLRAFIRLLQEEKHTGNLKLSAKLKDLYFAAGAVRDLQLFQGRLHSAEEDRAPLLPKFSGCVQRNLFREKERLVRKIEKMDWDKEHKSLIQSLPGVLHDSSIRQFINRKVAAIHIMQLVADKEEDLHSTRKHLKDMMYMVRIWQHDVGMDFPVAAWKNEAQLSEMAARLGDFNDLSITVTILQEFGCEGMPNQEQEVLNEWQAAMAQQLQEKKTDLLQEMKQIELLPV